MLRIRFTAAGAALLMGSVAIASDLPSPRALGFTQADYSDVSGDSVSLIGDPTTGWQIRITYHRKRNILDERPGMISEIFGKDHSLIEREEVGTFYQSLETRWPTAKKQEVRSTGPYSYRLLAYEWRKNAWALVSDSPLPLKAVSDSCPQPLSFEELSAKLSSIEPVVRTYLLNGVYDEETKIAGNIVARGCGGYEHSLADDVRDAFDQGLRCLAGLSHWKPAPNGGAEFALAEHPPDPKILAYWRAQVAKLLGLLSTTAPSPFTLTCETPDSSQSSISKDVRAVSNICGRDSGAPGMTLNLDYFNSSSRAERLAILFHELVHQTGLLHESGKHPNHFDAVYGAQMCCMGADNRGRESMVPDDTSEVSCAELMTLRHLSDTSHW